MASVVGSSTIQLFNAKNMRNLRGPDFGGLASLRFGPPHSSLPLSAKIHPALPERLRPRLDGGLWRDAVEPCQLVAGPGELALVITDRL